MKRATYFTLMLILAVLALAGCAPAPAAGPDLQPQLDQLTAQNEKLAGQVADLETARDGAQADLAQAQDAIKELEANLAAKTAGLADIQQIISAVELQNPSSAALMVFLEADDTDKIPYDATGFDCDGFSITVRDNAAKLGIRGGFVDIQYSNQAIGHAVAVFETTDLGKIYIDCINQDDIAYVKHGEIYGTVPINALKTRFIMTSGDPARFWEPLEYTNYGLSLYDYPYYANYSQRVVFFRDSMNAYNQAVDRYNGGDRTVTVAQLTQWQKNIQALGDDLGEGFVLPGDQVIALVMEFWN